MRFYTTCPPSSAYAPDTYAKRVAQVAEWAEDAGAEGALIYTDNGLADPWTVAQTVLMQTRRLVPMVATQPIYMPPFSVAKRITSLALMHGRHVALNMVAGGFPRDLAALGDETAHDDRYARLEEYVQIFQSLLRGETVTIEGRFYRQTGLSLQPAMPAELLPEIFLSSSSPAGRMTAAALGATEVSYPPPPGEIAADPAERPTSVVRLGLIARDTHDEAWAIAQARFPADPRGNMMHRMAMATSDSAWHRLLSEMGSRISGQEGVYWLHPFQTYRTFCPYLVGSHDEVAAALASYRAQGVRGLILDVPATEEDLPHTARAIAKTAARVAA